MCAQTAHRGVYGEKRTKLRPLHEGRKGFMPLSLFERFVEGAWRDGVVFEVFSLMWLGESLLHPQFEEMLECLFKHQKIFRNLVLNTNGTLFTPEIARAFVRFKTPYSSPPTTIIFSLDAATARTWRCLKGKDLFDQTISRIEYLLDLKAGLRNAPESPFNVVMQMLVMPENFHEIVLFRDMWKEKFESRKIPFDICFDGVYGPNTAKIYFKRVCSAKQKEAEELHRKAVMALGLLPELPEASSPASDERILSIDSALEIVEPEKRRPCPALWRSATLNWDGYVTTCCIDTEMELTFGDLSRESFAEAWTGRRLTELRLAHIKGEFEKIPVCARCLGLPAPAIPDSEIREYLESVGHTELIELYEKRTKDMSRVTRRRNYYIKRPHTLKGPKQTLIVETVSMCNLKCPMCEQSFEKRPGKGVMSFDLWKSIMDELASTEARINCLNPFWSGEALLHPEIIRMLAYAKEVNKEGKAFSTMDLHTNGNLLSEEISQEIVNGGLFERVLISIDAASPETYERMRTGGDFDRVVRNVKTLLDIRDRFSRELPRLTLQFVVSGVNFHEASLFVKYWGEEFSKRNREYQVNYDWNRPEPLRKDAIFLKRLDTVDDLLQVEAEKLHREVARQLGLVGSEKSSRIVDSDEFRIKDGIHLLTGEKEPPRPPCVGLWTHFAIKWDGEVTACCRDIRCELGLGKYGDMSIAEFLNCELLTNYRLAHIKGEFGRVPRCTYCQGQVSPRLEHDEVITYLESISREDLIPFYRKRMKLEPC